MSKLVALISLVAALAVPAVASAACTVLASVSGKSEVVLPGGVANAVVVVEGGRIAAAAPRPIAGLELDGSLFRWRGAVCAHVDTTGRTVTTGLVETMSHLGLVEVGLENATNDMDAETADPVRAALRVADAYNPRSSLIPIQRLHGLTSAVILPRGGRIAGQAAWVDLAGASQAAAVIDPSVAMVASLGGPSRAQSLLELRELLDDAQQWRTKRAAWEQNRSRPFAASRLDLEALQPVLRREIPLIVGANRAADIEALLRLGDEVGVKLVIVGAAEGWLVADRLAAAKVVVILDPLVYGPGSFQQIHARSDNAALLHAAGVPVILSTFDTHNARNLRQIAGNAVRAGLPRDEALRAITSRPAEVFASRDYGRLEPGAVANLVVWTGDPLELTTSVQAVFVQGRTLPLQSRQTELLERYRTLPGTPSPPLPLPSP